MLANRRHESPVGDGLATTQRLQTRLRLAQRVRSCDGQRSYVRRMASMLHDVGA